MIKYNNKNITKTVRIFQKQRGFSIKHQNEKDNALLRRLSSVLIIIFRSSSHFPPAEYFLCYQAVLCCMQFVTEHPYSAVYSMYCVLCGLQPNMQRNARTQFCCIWTCSACFPHGGGQWHFHNRSCTRALTLLYFSLMSLMFSMCKTNGSKQRFLISPARRRLTLVFLLERDREGERGRDREGALRYPQLSAAALHR